MKKPVRHEKSKSEWIYGLNPVLEAIRSGREISSVFISLSRKDRSDIEKEIEGKGIKIQRADRVFFDSRFPKGNQGLAALVAPREYTPLEDLLEIPAARSETPLFLILDCIEDPRNFGSILRIADAGGVHGVVVQSHRSALLGPEAVKASAGAAEYVAVSVVSNIKHAMKAMKELGIIILGAEAGMGSPGWEQDLAAPLALVLGSEGRGLRKTVREDCDALVNLPMKGVVNSLNASVAAGILVFEIMRQRAGKGRNC